MAATNLTLACHAGLDPAPRAIAAETFSNSHYLLLLNFLNPCLSDNEL
jgi:hypothetical protein